MHNLEDVPGKILYWRIGPRKGTPRIFSDENEHWLWDGAVNPTSLYPVMQWGGRLRVVHRVLYELMNQKPLDCRIYRRDDCPRTCVNPNHMSLSVSLGELRRRRKLGLSGRKSSLPEGLSYAGPGNTYIRAQIYDPRAKRTVVIASMRRAEPGAIEILQSKYREMRREIYGDADFATDLDMHEAPEETHEDSAPVNNVTWLLSD